MQKRSVSYLQHLNFTCGKQYGLIEGRKTCNALADHIKHLSEGLENGLTTVGIYRDLSRHKKSFWYRPPLETAKQTWSPGGFVLEWFRSYPKGKTMYIEINETRSDGIEIERGVPQWSRLLRLRFLIHIHDLCAMKTCRQILCALRTILHRAAEDLTEMRFFE